MQLFNSTKIIGEEHLIFTRKKQSIVPNGIWLNCSKCGYSFYYKEQDEYKTCPKCDYGFRITARERIGLLVDKFNEIDTDLYSEDPLKFPGYKEKLEKARKLTNLNDGVLTGFAEIGDHKIGLGIMDPYFIMGSMGTVVGEKITRLFEKSLEKKLPVILVIASGGARMQEGIFSLMQMAKISNAVKKHSEAGLLYISLLTDPTTGGVTASFAMQADIILAEPKAIIGFAGRRVIEQTIHQKVPEDLQNAENVLKHGFIDKIVSRSKQKEYIKKLLIMNERG